MTIAWLALAIRLALTPAPAPVPGYLYRTTLIQAAPGKLLEVVDLLKAGWPGSKDSGDEPPIAMRHSQGDRWDLLLLFPMGSWGEYYAADRIARRQKAGQAAMAELVRLSGDVAWTEDVFVYGPPLDETRAALANGRLLPRRDVRGAARNGARALPPARDGERVSRRPSTSRRT